MQRKIILLLFKYNIIFCCFCELIDALVGKNVKQATEGEFRNVVAILQRSDRIHTLRYDVICTGTLITRSHVLSSEHCVENMGTHGLIVRVGSIDLRQAVPHYIAWWITYDWWANFENITIEFSTNDINILKLYEQVFESIIPALLIPVENSYLFGLDVVLAGWGKTEDDLNPYIMHKVDVKVISTKDCESIAFRMLQNEIEITKGYLCTLAEPTALLNDGDSGGPIFFGCFILGINYGTCPKTPYPIDPRVANIHSSVDYYRQFIESNMLI